MMAGSSGLPVVIKLASVTSLVESLLGLACCVVYFLFNSCVLTVGCPDTNSWAARTAFSFYTSYVVSEGSCNLTGGESVFSTNENSRTQPDDIFVDQVLYSVLYLAWIVASILLLRFSRGVWWASTWLLVTLAVTIFDLTTTSFILTDFSREVKEPGNCGLQPPHEESRTLSIVAMLLYTSRGALLWILNVVLLGWILSIAVKAARQKPPVDLDTVKLYGDDDDNQKGENNNNFWINRNFGEAADDDDDFDVNEARDNFGTTGGRNLYGPSPSAMYRQGGQESSHYAQPHLHLPAVAAATAPQFYGAEQQQQQQQPPPPGRPGGGPGVRRNSSLLERIRAANNAPVVEGGLWSYGRVPKVGDRPLPVPPVQIEKDVDNAFGFLNSYDTAGPNNQPQPYPSLERSAVPRHPQVPSLEGTAAPRSTKQFNIPRTRTSTASVPPAPEMPENGRGPFSIPRVRNMASRKVSRTSSMLSNSDRDMASSPGSEGYQKRYFVPLKE